MTEPAKPSRISINNKSKLFDILRLLLIALILTGCDSFPEQLTATAQAAEIMTLTIAPTPTFTPSSIHSLKPTPAAGDVMIWAKDGMKLYYVPAGEFMMGNTAEAALAECQKYALGCELRFFKNESPPHEVNLNAFWIDETEITNRMYALCVAAKACQPPGDKSSSTRTSYYDDTQYMDYPVIYVYWNDAKTYCDWAGRELPSEAQWEKAARGTDQRTYPWGNKKPNKELLNYISRDTTQVGSYKAGKSPYGALDMAGNVSEWVNDPYEAYPGGEPSVLFGQKDRVLRGGSWSNGENVARSTNRGSNNADYYRDNYLGFRCALSAP